MPDFGFSPHTALVHHHAGDHDGLQPCPILGIGIILSQDISHPGSAASSPELPYGCQKFLVHLKPQNERVLVSLSPTLLDQLMEIPHVWQANGHRQVGNSPV